MPGQSRLRAVAALLSPTVLGTAIILCVLTDNLISSQVRDSEIVSSVAVVVGASLILGSIALYIRNPTEFDRHQLSNSEQVQALVVAQAETAQVFAAHLPPDAAAQALLDSGLTRRGGAEFER